MEDLHSYSYGLLYATGPEFIASLQLFDHANENVTWDESDSLVNVRSIKQAVLTVLKHAHPDYVAKN